MLFKEPWTVLGFACWSIITLGSAHHDQFCWKHDGAYCETPWDVVHGPHRDQPIHWIRLSGSVIPSTSSRSDGMTTVDFFISR
jgi:hypothetical protein